ncbi:MAG: hypothetical protein ACM3VW_00360, partial [Bacteroidota bacterium]
MSLSTASIVAAAIVLTTVASAQVGVPWSQAKEMARPHDIDSRTFLVRGGRPSAVIAIPDDPEYAAAGELIQKAVAAKLPGVSIPIVRASTLVSGPAHAFNAA